MFYPIDEEFGFNSQGFGSANLARQSIDTFRPYMVRNSKILGRLQRYSVFRSLALGINLGLGIGAGALLDIVGLIGRGVCLVVLDTAFWFAWDAEPVLVGTDVEPELKPEPAPDELPPEPPVEADRASHGTLLSIAQFWAPCQRVLPPRLPLPNPPDPMRPLPRGQCW